MRRWHSWRVLAVAVSGLLPGACGDDRDTGEGVPSTDSGTGEATTLDPPPPLPPPTPTVDDFLSACIAGFPELPQPMFEEPSLDSDSDTDGDASTGDGSSSGAPLTSDGDSTGVAPVDDSEDDGTTGSTSLGDGDDGTTGTSIFSDSSGDGTTGTVAGSSGSDDGTTLTSLASTDETTDASIAHASPRVRDGIAWPLRETGHLVGVAITGSRLETPDYARVAAQQFNYVIPENEMKWNAVERLPGLFDFRNADKIMEFAYQHHMKVKGHTLVWHSQLPTWMEELEGTEPVREAMIRHIEQTMLHFKSTYPGVLVAWDVVNEAIDTANGVASFRDSVFFRELGEGFIAEAFEVARATDPDALLFYNDYGIESLGAKSQATYEMVRRMVESGVPIDGVGFQMHTSAFDWGPTRADFEQNLQRYVDLGLLVNISEMDVTLCYGFEDREQAFAAQRERIRQIVGTCLQFEACESISFWGVGDQDSWINSHRPCENTAFEPWPLLFDDNYQPKPAWYGAYDAMTGCIGGP